MSKEETILGLKEGGEYNIILIYIIEKKHHKQKDIKLLF